MLLPVPGGPTKSKCRFCEAATLAILTASSWPMTCASGSLGMGISPVFLKRMNEKGSKSIKLFRNRRSGTMPTDTRKKKNGSRTKRLTVNCRLQVFLNILGKHIDFKRGVAEECF